MIAGVAAVGATAMAITPIAQPEVLTSVQRVSSAVELAAFANPVEVLLATLADTSASIFDQAALLDPADLFWPDSFYTPDFSFVFAPGYYGLIPDFANQVSFGGLSAVVTNLSGYVYATTEGLAGLVGGPVTAGSPYIVGEEGPELFVPGRSGTIVPNGALTSGTSGGAVGGEQEELIPQLRHPHEPWREALDGLDGRAHGGGDHFIGQEIAAGCHRLDPHPPCLIERSDERPARRRGDVNVHDRLLERPCRSSELGHDGDPGIATGLGAGDDPIARRDRCAATQLAGFRRQCGGIDEG